MRTSSRMPFCAMYHELRVWLQSCSWLSSVGVTQRLTHCASYGVVGLLAVATLSLSLPHTHTHTCIEDSPDSVFFFFWTFFLAANGERQHEISQSTHYIQQEISQPDFKIDLRCKLISKKISISFWANALLKTLETILNTNVFESCL